LKAATANRVHYGGVVRKIAAAAIGVCENTIPTRLGEEQGGGCLARKGPQYRGRGETAGDCVFTAKTFRTAAVDRAVPDLPVPYGILPSPVFEAHARFVGKHRKRRWREDEELTQGKIRDRLRERRPGGAFVSGGCEGTGGSYSGPEFGRRDSPCRRSTYYLDC
jgi:hypothetical protein